MSASICFVVPVRHHENMRDPVASRKYLQQTLASIANQTTGNWKAVVVANEGTYLPSLPNNVHVKRVTLPANPAHEKVGYSTAEHLNFVRMDKGLRIEAAMDVFMSCKYTMFVDDDDFVSNRLVDYLEHAVPEHGVVFQHGYLWPTGGNFLFPLKNFYRRCGTSHIIRSKYFDKLLAEYDEKGKFISEMLGAHIFVRERMRNLGCDLDALPFRGAVYRMNNTNSHSSGKKGNSIWVEVMKGGGLNPRRPDLMISHLSETRYVRWAGATFGMFND